MVGIPLFQNRVAPRLDCACEMLVLKVNRKEVKDTRYITLNWHNALLTLNQIKEMGIEVIICGAVPCFIARFLIGNGIKLIPWVSGEWQEALEAFLEGRLEEKFYFFSGPLCKTRKRGWRKNKR